MILIQLKMDYEGAFTLGIYPNGTTPEEVVQNLIDNNRLPRAWELDWSFLVIQSWTGSVRDNEFNCQKYVEALERAIKEQ